MVKTAISLNILPYFLHSLVSHQYKLPMLSNLCAHKKGFPTLLIVIKFITSMNSLVYKKNSVGSKQLPTFLIFTRFSISMDSLVLTILSTQITTFSYSSLYNFIYLFWLCFGLHCCAGFSLGVWGLLASFGAGGAHCGDFSCCGAQALRNVGFSSCGELAK